MDQKLLPVAIFQGHILFKRNKEGLQVETHDTKTVKCAHIRVNGRILLPNLYDKNSVEKGTEKVTRQTHIW